MRNESHNQLAPSLRKDEIGHYEAPLLEGGQGNAASNVACCAFIAAGCFALGILVTLVNLVIVAWRLWP